MIAQSSELFGVALRDARMKASLGQRGLAQKLGVGQTIISKWEAGEVRPNESEAQRLRSVLPGLPVKGGVETPTQRVIKESHANIAQQPDSLGLPRVSLSCVMPNPYNPRPMNDPCERKQLEELAVSIRESGNGGKTPFFAPPILYRVEGRKDIWSAIAGHRRIEAARILGWKEIFYVSSALIGLSGTMSHEEARQYLLRDQLIIRRFDKVEFYKLIFYNISSKEKARADLPKKNSIRQMEYLACHAPGWMNEMVFAHMLTPYTAYAIARAAYGSLGDLGDPMETMRYLADKRASGEWTTREQIREWIVCAKHDKVRAIQDIQSSTSRKTEVIYGRAPGV